MNSCQFLSCLNGIITSPRSRCFDECGQTTVGFGVQGCILTSGRDRVVSRFRGRKRNYQSFAVEAERERTRYCIVWDSGMYRKLVCLLTALGISSTLSIASWLCLSACFIAPSVLSHIPRLEPLICHRLCNSCALRAASALWCACACA